jgi:hypothetical protein
LVSLLPNLEVLKLNTKSLWDANYGNIAGLKEQFGSLRELTVVAPKRMHNTFVSFKPIARLLQLPHLTSLELKYFDIGMFFWYEAPSTLKYPKASLAIERLTIRNCSMTNTYMQGLITACRRLTHFNYKAWDDGDEQDK